MKLFFADEEREKEEQKPQEEQPEEEEVSCDPMALGDDEEGCE